MTKKYIHYCWFGDKPLPRLAKKCIKSWKKYLPDYEIIKWSEENVDLNECPFIKEAYENKKWAFVADYARTKAMYEYGGIYFDTDMLVTKNIDFLLDKPTFLGIEDSGYIACGVWYEKNANAYLPTKMLEFYNGLPHFNIEDMYEISIPRIISNILDDFNISNKEIQKLKHNIYIYPRDYFYPLSYDRQNNIFTQNTCMIHYYDASWAPRWEQRDNRIFRLFGKKMGKIIIKLISIFKKIIKVPLYPLIKYRKRMNVIKNVETQVQKFINANYIAVYHSNWIGTAYATKEIFDNIISVEELYDKKEIEKIADTMAKANIKLIIFSAFANGWKDLILEIKKINPKIKIKVLWHGSNAMNVEDYDWNMLKQIFELLNTSKINSIGFVKKTMYKLYKEKGYNVEFVMNTVNLNSKNYILNKPTNSDDVKIGLYASGDRWVKNFYNQLSAASLVKNASIDCIPLSNKTVEFSKILHTNLTGEFKPLKRDELLKRISKNDINIYATFVECAPLLPLESLELGVPCITGNNHHYWKDTELEKYLIVDNVDDIFQIHKKIELCLKNKEKIIKLYKKWKKSYDKEAKKSIDNFLK